MPHLSGGDAKYALQTSSTEMTPSQWSGKAFACAVSVLRRYSSQAKPAWPMSPSAHVHQPSTAYQEPPGHAVLLLTGGSDCSVAPGSPEPGAIAAPIFEGPLGAPMPTRTRRYAATSFDSCAGGAAPASSAHACGSDQIDPTPIWRVPE